MEDILRISGILSAVLIGVLYVLYRQYEASKENKETKERIAQAESKVQAEPEKAKPAWDLARATLEAYFNRNLGQISYIFWLSVVVMMVGFVILVWGVSQSIKHPDLLAPAAIAGLGGIITEFIGATFLFIYRSTIQQAIDYSMTLERINSVGMAMQILDTMPDMTDTDDLKSHTKAKLVELLVLQVQDGKRPQDKAPNGSGKVASNRRKAKSRSE